MGLFSFFKKAGSKVLDNSAANEAAEDAAAANARRASLLSNIVESMGVDIDNLAVDYDGETVTVSGQTETQADREKIILALGNVDGVASVDDRISVVKEEVEAIFYEVKSGDSLSKIAKAHYGDPMKYKDIFEANQPLLEDPNKIYPGQVLRIPTLEA